VFAVPFQAINHPDTVATPVTHDEVIELCKLVVVRYAHIVAPCPPAGRATSCTVLGDPDPPCIGRAGAREAGLKAVEGAEADLKTIDPRVSRAATPGNDIGLGQLERAAQELDHLYNLRMETP